MWNIPNKYECLKTNEEKNLLIKPKPFKTEIIPDVYDKAMSIDNNGTIDIDDMFWIEKLSHKNYQIDIYIPDITYYLRSNSLIDIEARRQMHTIYNDKYSDNIRMLPSLFSKNHVRLTKGVVRRCLKLRFLFNSDSVYTNLIKISKCYAKNTQSFNYYEADNVFKRLNPNKDTDNLLVMVKEITYLMYQKRLENKHFVSNNLLSKKGFKSEYWIRELMIMCNSKIGELFFQNNIKALYLKTLDTEEKTKSYYEYFGSSQDINYISITSPIRKYVDIVNHRILKNFLNKKPSPYLDSDLKRICQHININIKNHTQEDLDNNNKLNTYDDSIKIEQQIELMKNHIEKFINTDIKPSLVLSNLPFKFKNIINNLKYNIELDLNNTQHKYIFNISGYFDGQFFSKESTGLDVHFLKEECAAFLLDSFIDL